MVNYLVELIFRLMLFEIGFREANTVRNHSQGQQVVLFLTPKIGTNFGTNKGVTCNSFLNKWFHFLSSKRVPF